MMQLLTPTTYVFIHTINVLFMLSGLSVGMTITLVFTKSRCSHIDYPLGIAFTNHDNIKSGYIGLG